MTNDDKELEQQVEQTIEASHRVARKMAKQRFNKNKREMMRLEKHAHKCLLLGNKEGYMYSIGKLRRIINKPNVSTETLEMLYETSRERVLEVLKGTAENGSKDA